MSCTGCTGTDVCVSALFVGPTGPTGPAGSGGGSGFLIKGSTYVARGQTWTFADEGITTALGGSTIYPIPTAMTFSKLAMMYQGPALNVGSITVKVLQNNVNVHQFVFTPTNVPLVPVVESLSLSFAAGDRLQIQAVGSSDMSPTPLGVTFMLSGA